MCNTKNTKNKNKILIIPFMLMLLLFGLVGVNGLTYNIDSSNLQESTVINMTWDATKYQTETGYYNARFTSDVIVFEDHIDINSLSVAPYDFHNLPNNNDVVGACDMTGNILLLHLDESSGSVIDSSGNDHNGYTVGNSARNVIGLHGTLAYNGISDGYIEIPHRDDLNLYGEGALVLAYYPKDSLDHALLSKEDTAANTGYRIYRDGDRIDIDFDDGFSAASSDSGAFPTLNTWYIVALSWENGVISYYSNGVSFGSDNLGNYTPNTKAIRIGADNTGIKELNGYIDEVALFNHSLTYDAVQSMTHRLLVDKEVTIKSCATILCDENYTNLEGSSPYDTELDINRYYKIQVDFERLNYDYDNALESITFEYDVLEDPTPKELRSQVYKTTGSDTYASFNNDVIGGWNEFTAYDLEQASRIVDNPDNLVTPKVAYMDDYQKYIIARDGENLVLMQWDGDEGVLNVKDGTDVILSGHTLMTDFLVRKYREHQYVMFLTHYRLNNDNYATLNYVSYDGDTFTHTTRNLGTQGRIRRVSHLYHMPLFNCFIDDEICVYGMNSYNQGFSVMGFSLTENLYSTGTSLPLQYHKSSYSARDADDCTYTGIGGNIVLGDIDNDYANGDEYDYDDAVMVHSFMGAFYLISLNVNKTHIWTDWVHQKSSGVSSGCNGGTAPYLQNPPIDPSLWITGVLAAEYNGYESDGKELFFGGVDGNTDNFKVFEFSAQGNDNDEHPDINNIEGQLMSNPFLMDCYAESGVEDVAILGYNQDTEKVLLECSCYTCGASNDDCEFEDYPEEDFNLSLITNNAKTVHVIESDGTKGSELVTPFGIYDVNEPEPHATYCGNNEIQKIYNIQERDSFILPIDYENTGRADLIIASPYRIKYLDDGFVNKKPTITDIKINPCIEKTWKLGSDVLIKVKGTDEENNDVSYRVVMYAGSPNETDSGWSSFMGVTEEYSFQTIAHTNIGVGYINIYIKDASHTTFNMVERYFSVNEDNTSATFGDCETVVGADELGGEQDLDLGGVDIEDPEYTDADGNKPNDNAITNSVKEVGSYFGFGGSLMYILCMIAISVFIWTTSKEHNVGTLGVVAIFNVGALILGVKLQLIGVGTLLTMVLLMLIIVGAALAKILRPSSNVGGF